MNAQEPVILIKKDGSWKDCSHQIVNVEKTVYGKVAVQFTGSPNTFLYNSQNVKDVSNRSSVECMSIEYDGKELQGFKEVFEYPDVSLYRIIWKDGKYKDIPKDGAILHRDVLKSQGLAFHVMAYYREVAAIIGQHSEEDTQKDFLKKQYGKLEYIDDQSVLATILQSTRPRPFPLSSRFVFPFGLNKSQYKAVDNAFSSSVSIIEGPPGTGKTQTILTIIANAIMQGKRIAVCSNNNEAVRNVYEKLEAAGYGGVVAMLGCAENEASFFSKPHPVPLFSPQNDDVTGATYDEYLDYVVKVQDAIERENALVSALGALKREEEDFLKTEFPCGGEEHAVIFSNPSFSPQECLSVLSILLDRKPMKKFGLWFRLYLFFGCRIGWKSTGEHPDVFIRQLKRCYYQAKQSEYRKELEDCRKKIAQHDLHDAMKKVLDHSRCMLDVTLQKRMEACDEEFVKDDYKYRFNEFTKRFPVVLSSTYSLRRTSGNGFLYDLLIMDEASQIGLDSAILALSCARNLVVVGDQWQLPQIDDINVVSDDRLQKQYSVPQAFRYHGNNILSCVVSVYGQTLPHVMLREHYRCQRDIIAFSNKRFYGNRLTCLTKPLDGGCHLRIIHTVSGNHARKNPTGSGLYNEREIEEVLKYVAEKKNNEDIAVIVPYRYQVEKLRKRVPDWVKVDTIHKFQGRECDEIIFSTVANSSDDYVLKEERIQSFVNNEGLVNVAMTRAKHCFTLVTSDKIFHQGTRVLGDLVRYMRYETHAEERSGTIRSVFDLLYDDYEAEREKYLTAKGNGGYLSEKLVADILDREFACPDYASFRYIQHLSLCDALVLEKNLFTNDEFTYVSNPWTHVDFAIINVFDKKPVLLIEVDGISYHEQNDRQTRHDAMKDKAVALSHIKLIRLRTNGSNESETIHAILQQQLAGGRSV